MAVIEVEHLVKQFQSVKKEKGLKGSVKALFKPERRTITAVKDISFSIEPGEIVGYIGPNGAGKSTTVKMMSGILTPTSGEVRINGISPVKNRTLLHHFIRTVQHSERQCGRFYWIFPMDRRLHMEKLRAELQ